MPRKTLKSHDGNIYTNIEELNGLLHINGGPVNDEELTEIVNLIIELKNKHKEAEEE